ncbi:MAG: hypothetical protein HC831_14710, partial [Chloroflexia bacterium]|nr:hypothetical protein [Chloroflexia bacterium]
MMLFVKGINVEFSQSLEEQYIDEKHVLELLEGEDGGIVGQPIKKLNIAKIEKKLNDNPYIQHAEVYKKINGILTVEAV